MYYPPRRAFPLLLIVFFSSVVAVGVASIQRITGPSYYKVTVRGDAVGGTFHTIGKPDRDGSTWTFRRWPTGRIQTIYNIHNISMTKLDGPPEDGK